MTESRSQPPAVDIMATLADGRAALSRGDWTAARAAFETALAADDGCAEAHAGLGEALWWLGDMQGTMSSYERAYAVFRRRQDPVHASLLALRIGFHHAAHLASDSAAAGWIARARRLIEENGLIAIRGELRLMEACVARDPQQAELCAGQALEAARAAADPDLELCALSAQGVALVEQGRVSDGMALLEEAMAGSLGGEGARLETVVFASCNMMTSCARCAEFERATQWVRAAERFAARYGCPFLHVDCRAVYGAVLLATGEWPAAETELRAAIELARGSVPTYGLAATASLAELRLCQGKLEEAERLAAGFEAHPGMAQVLAGIFLRRGEPTRAAAIVHRHLEGRPDAGPDKAIFLELLGEACVARGSTDEAAGIGAALVRLGNDRGCRVVAARGERLRGRALAAARQPEARRHLDIALLAFTELGMPYEAARTRALIAPVLHGSEPDAAVAEARAALESFEALGAAGDADAAAALLRSFGISAARSGPRTTDVLTRREGEVLALLGEGLSNPEMAERLFISRKTVEHHVARVLAKLGLRSRAEAAAVAVRRARQPPGFRSP